MARKKASGFSTRRDNYKAEQDKLIEEKLRLLMRLAMALNDDDILDAMCGLSSAEMRKALEDIIPEIIEAFNNAKTQKESKAEEKKADHSSGNPAVNSTESNAVGSAPAVYPTAPVNNNYSQ